MKHVRWMLFLAIALTSYPKVSHAFATFRMSSFSQQPAPSPAIRLGTLHQASGDYDYLFASPFLFPILLGLPTILCIVGSSITYYNQKAGIISYNHSDPLAWGITTLVTGLLSSTYGTLVLLAGMVSVGLIMGSLGLVAVGMGITNLVMYGQRIREHKAMEKSKQYLFERRSFQLTEFQLAMRF